MATPAVENYLKAIYLLEVKTGKPAPISKVAERLAVAPASVTEMVQRLARDGLVKHARYRGVGLTEQGRRSALAVVRRHRLLETFLVSELGMDWAQVHEEAEALEHSISDRLVTAIAAKLGEPSRDPHGDPIPSAELEIDEAETVPVDQLPVGARGHLVRILDADGDLLAYLDRLGIRLGDEVEVLALEPYGGPYTVAFSGRSRSLGRLAAGALAVEVN
ncbi:MAG TPA: metal-dependent transcriptional regulator [Thermoleophilia bacterium]|nr:metal-dependent transcriptional regulator [Thermoleophilia bacterium]